MAQSGIKLEVDYIKLGTSIQVAKKSNGKRSWASFLGVG